MRMNTKAFWMLALLTVLVIGVVLISGCVGPAEKTGPGGITVPSGFTEHTVPFLGLFPDMEGVTVTAYLGSGTAENALDVFKSAAIDAGWTRMEGEVEIPVTGIPSVEIAGTVITGAGFEKGNEMLVINVVQAEDQVTVMVIVGPKEVIIGSKDIEDAPVEEVTPEEVGPPTSDVVGEDIPDVPRYPGSIRTGYSIVVETGLTTIGYVTSSSVDEVVDFYERELPANGWEILDKFPIEGTVWLTAHKDEIVVKVISGPSDEYIGYTVIGIILEILV